MITTSLSGMGQVVDYKTWVNADHQTLEFDGDSAVFRNGGREERFAYKLDADQLILTGAKSLVFSVIVTTDSLKLSEWVVEGGLKKKGQDGDAVRLNHLMRLSDYDELTFANATTLAKPFEDFKSIRFQSNACMGNCPVLDVTLNANREINFKGEANAEHMGVFTATVDRAKMKDICSFVKSGDLVGLRSRLKTPLDFPTYTLTIDYGNEESRYRGYSFYNPLNQLVQQFLDFDTTLKLKKLE